MMVILKKNIRYYYKRNDKKYADMQKLLTQACTSVINIANNCVEANKSNKTVELRDFDTNTADAITILTKLNTMLTNERKKKIKTSTL